MNYETNTFPPICPKCGNGTVWMSDNTLEELGYEGEGVVHSFLCSGCERLLEFEDLGDGNMALLSVCTSDEDEPMEFTDYCKLKYDV